MDLVSAHGKQIDPAFLRIDPEFSVRLDRIHMYQRFGTLFMHERRCLLNRLYGSDLIVDMHE